MLHLIAALAISAIFLDTAIFFYRLSQEEDCEQPEHEWHYVPRPQRTYDRGTFARVPLAGVGSGRRQHGAESSVRRRNNR